MTERPSPTRGSAEGLNGEELARINAYWRAANYPSIGQIYLLDNSLLREPWRGSTSNRGCSDTGAANAKRISRQSGRVFVYVVPTDEERMLAEHAVRSLFPGMSDARRSNEWIGR